MLSIFPDLLIYNLLGITILRVTLGFMGVYLAFKVLSKRNQIVEFVASKIPFVFISKISPWIIFVLFIISGGMLIIGLYTQIACIVLAYLFLKILFIDIFIKDFSGNTTIFYVGLIIISLALLFLGPGTFAYDLPF
jgi:uncharacterized membrane protein YphA (DoxX/SURF4 family)